MTSDNPSSIGELDVLILAGGTGTRLQDHVPGVPKPLAPVGGQPFLNHQLDWLARQGVRSATLAVHHMADQLIAFAQAKNGDPLPLHIVREAQPLGTGGAIVNAFDQRQAKGSWLVVNGDTAFNFDVALLLSAHRRRGAQLTLAICEVADSARYGTVVCEGTDIISFRRAAGAATPGYVNCGAYIIEAKLMALAPAPPFSVEHDFFPDLAKSRSLNAVRIPAEMAFFDIGTPDSYDDYCARHQGQTE